MPGNTFKQNENSPLDSAAQVQKSRWSQGWLNVFLHWTEPENGVGSYLMAISVVAGEVSSGCG